MKPERALPVTLILKTTRDTAGKIATLLQRGFVLPVTGTISIAELLIELPGFNEEYIRDRVQTIFVNGIAEDNTNRELAAGDSLALSAAMPGLAGAIFRRGGQHASLRTRPEAVKSDKTDYSGFITLKLFNMIATETGPQLLQDGILIKGKTLARFLDRQGERILPVIERSEVEGTAVELAELTDIVAD
ncbi:MAG: hypothetical protein JRJ37_04710, partial [Deltaproteobacteria bacterium]|nr:hypothetical protein [Deltaproteobacteria bacterium]